jgi:5-methyltetrahydrofolate--homocysteine methyltransferase
MNFPEKLASLVADLADPDDVRRVTEEALAAGIEPNVMVKSGLAAGMDIVGKKYEAGEYFIADLIMAATLMQEALGIVKPHLKGVEVKGTGRVAIGTVRGDLHDIGKNIVIAMLRAARFEVDDLGVDVEPEKFVGKIRESEPDIVGMSALLTSTLPEMKTTIDAIKANGLRDRVKIIIGGRVATQDYADKMGADAYGEDAPKAVEKAVKLVEKKGLTAR